MSLSQVLPAVLEPVVERLPQEMQTEKSAALSVSVVGDPIQLLAIYWPVWPMTASCQGSSNSWGSRRIHFLTFKSRVRGALWEGLAVGRFVERTDIMAQGKTNSCESIGGCGNIKPLLRGCGTSFSRGKSRYLLPHTCGQSFVPLAVETRCCGNSNMSQHV